MTTDWTTTSPEFGKMSDRDRARLAALRPVRLPAHASLFHPGDMAQGYAVVLTGRIDVFLVGTSGREMLLYSVEPGQSCVQTTLGLIAGVDYTAGAETATEAEVVIVPRALFLDLLEGSHGFRDIVFRAFADRMNIMIQLLEKVAFTRVECRLAEEILRLSTQDGHVAMTQADLAARIGSAREVVSRRLDIWTQRGWVRTGRGSVTVLDRDALSALAQAET